ncbi:MAG: hypothetical protein NTX64_15975, partial [Elusimicrobia bacterium]|nr:hypothetical protein [Elusimicrobiota bacterium]
MVLRSRFTLANSLLVGAVLAATGTLQYAAERRQLVRAQAAAQGSAARALAKACEEAVLENNDVAALNYFKAFRETPALRDAALANADGRLRLHSDALRGSADWQGRVLADEAARRALAATEPVRDEAPGEDGGRLVVWTAGLRVRGKPAGLLRLRFDAAEMDRSMRAQLAAGARRF